MRITKYRAELNEDRINILVKESATNYNATDKFNTARKIVDMLNSIYNLKNQSEEYLYMLAMRSNCTVAGLFEVSHGTINASLCDPKTIFKNALLCNAIGIIIAHNHPSGSVSPSREDVQVADRLRKAGDIIGIDLLDSIIVGDGFLSMKEAGYLSE